ncbi:MAG: hypothetical protein ACK41W_10995 [Cyanobacteriota bacterium]|jgi:hypothetical protein
MTDAPQASPFAGTWDQVIDEQDGCTIFQRGRHHDGTFIRVYVPKRAKDPAHPPRVILYLHGFALCLPDFYQDHLRELARQGWIVIFPDFQRGTYREEPLPGAVGPRSAARLSPKWGRTTRQLLRRGRDEPLNGEDLPEELTITDPSTGLPDLQVGDLRRVLLPWLLIQLVLKVIGWFRRTYARNLGELIGTVLLSLAYRPVDWLRNAVALAENAWDDLARRPEYAHWANGPVATYGFGHSLGGLLSLSLPALRAENPSSRLPPRGILAADPATSTEMGIPSFAIALLKLFNAPFTAEPLRIQDTGPKIDIPVAILHGLDDTIVPPQQWAVRGGEGAFPSVGGPSKALYFASSNRERDPKLVAFHNQAVTSTQTYDDELFASFGGVKHGPNAYNTDWIWPALHALFVEGVSPPDLKRHLRDEHKEPPFAVTTEPPPPPPRRWPWLLMPLVLIGVGVALLAWWRG